MIFAKITLTSKETKLVEPEVMASASSSTTTTSVSLKKKALLHSFYELLNIATYSVYCQAGCKNSAQGPCSDAWEIN